MPRIRELLVGVRPRDNAEHVTLKMTAAERGKVKRKFTAPDGLELNMTLPKGVHLSPGMVLHIEQNKQYIVDAAPEECLVIRPTGPRDAARAGHLIGSLERSIDFDGDCVVTLCDANLEARLKDLGFSVARQTRPFLGRPNPS